MGIILLKSLTPVATNGLHTNRFSEFDDDEEMYSDEDEGDEAEALMEEEGLYSHTNGGGVLEMQMLDESNGHIAAAEVAGADLPETPDTFGAGPL